MKEKKSEKKSIQEKEEKAEQFWKDEKTTRAAPPKKERKPRQPPKVNLDGEKIRDGLAQLILTVVEMLRELMEKQAIRRIEAGSLQPAEIERLGNTFMALKKELKKLREHFKIEEEDLNIDLGPIIARPDETQTKQVSAVEILDRLLGKGVVVRGDIVISVADVDLLALNLGLLLASTDKAKELYGMSAVRTAQLEQEVETLKEENLRLKNASK
jgi:hypothetical protein